MELCLPGGRCTAEERAGVGSEDGALDSAFSAFFLTHCGSFLLSRFPHRCSMYSEDLDPEIKNSKPTGLTLLKDYHGLTPGSVMTRVPCPL